MKTKTIMLLALAALAMAVLAGCAQDSTDTSNDNPRMQEEIMKEQSGSQSTNPTRTESSGTSSSSSGATKLSLVADPTGNLKWKPTSLKAQAGSVTIDLTNESPVEHDVALAGSGGKILGQSKKVTKGSADLTIKDLKAGTYQYFCTIPGHKQAGMVGELTVR